MVAKRQNIIQLPSEQLDFKMVERVSKMIPALNAFKPRIQLINKLLGMSLLATVGNKSANAFWIGEGESLRTVVGRDGFDPKSMFYVFFKQQVSLIWVMLKKGTPYERLFWSIL